MIRSECSKVSNLLSSYMRDIEVLYWLIFSKLEIYFTCLRYFGFFYSSPIWTCVTLERKIEVQQASGAIIVYLLSKKMRIFFIFASWFCFVHFSFCLKLILTKIWISSERRKQFFLLLTNLRCIHYYDEKTSQIFWIFCPLRFLHLQTWFYFCVCVCEQIFDHLTTKNVWTHITHQSAAISIRF